jgi:hypothetical protein
LGVTLFTDVGDLLIGADTSVVTTAGLQTVAELAERRDRRAIGRMEGRWPLLEKAAISGELRTGAGSSSRILQKIAALCNISSDDRPVFRVGTHPRSRLMQLETLAIQRSCAVREGLTGWKWMVPQQRSAVAATSSSLEDPLVECALALWQVTQDGHIVLPMELVDARAFSLGMLYYCGRNVRVDYRPRYLPRQVSLELDCSSAPHARIQAVVENRSPSFTDVAVTDPGCYMVVNGLLCA